MTDQVICTCPKCQTPHVVLWIDKSVGVSSEQTISHRPITKQDVDAFSAPYQINKAKEQGYDLAKCLETVMKGDSLSQCTRANGYGLEKLYCKQHSVKHKAKES